VRTDEPATAALGALAASADERRHPVTDVGVSSTVALAAAQPEGPTLRALLSNGRLPALTAVDYAIQIANRLAALHDEGQVHGQLAPERLVVLPVGDVRVLRNGVRPRTGSAAAYGSETLVVSLDAFEHFEDPAAVLRAIYELLRPGGSLVTREFCTSIVRCRLRRPLHSTCI
jgi:SAM-dependent methyltransferase